jgi:hypothetical protein
MTILRPKYQKVGEQFDPLYSAVPLLGNPNFYAYGVIFWTFVFKATELLLMGLLLEYTLQLRGLYLGLETERVAPKDKDGHSVCCASSLTAASSLALKEYLTGSYGQAPLMWGLFSMTLISSVLVLVQYRSPRAGLQKIARAVDKIGVPVEVFLYGALMAALSGEGEASNVGANKAFRDANCRAVHASDAADKLKCSALFTGDAYTGEDVAGPILDLIDMRPAHRLAVAGAFLYFAGFVLNHVFVPKLPLTVVVADKDNTAEDECVMKRTKRDGDENVFWYYMKKLFGHTTENVWACAGPALVLGRKKPKDVTEQQNASGPPVVEAAMDYTYTDW